MTAFCSDVRKYILHIEQSFLSCFGQADPQTGHAVSGAEDFQRHRVAQDFDFRIPAGAVDEDTVRPEDIAAHDDDHFFSKAGQVVGLFQRRVSRTDYRRLAAAAESAVAYSTVGNAAADILLLSGIPRVRSFVPDAAITASARSSVPSASRMRNRGVCQLQDTGWEFFSLRQYFPRPSGGQHS